MKIISPQPGRPIREPGPSTSLQFRPRLTSLASVLFLALPLFGQYTEKNVTPAGSAAARLTSTSSAGARSVGSNSLNHAILYDSNLNQTIDLNFGMTTSTAKGTDGIEEVGYSRISTSYYDNCTVWKGTAASALVLTPPGASGTWCLGTDGGREIGWDYRPVYIYVTQHAILWSGTPNSYVDLHAGGFTYSRGRAIHGHEQVGEIDTVPSTDPESGNMANSQAVLWHDTAASMVFLNPAGYVASAALATNGSQEGGWARPANSTAHAMMWSGSSASAVDLHPAGYFDTRVSALSATTQVGDGWVGGAAHSAGAHRHALAWTGSAASVTDLHLFAPAGYTDSVATGIDSAGNVVGYAFKTATLGDHLPIDAIALVFAATPGPSAPISSLSLSPARVNPGDTLTGLITLANPATAGGATVTFVSDNPAVLPAPADVVVPEGATTAAFVTPVSPTPLAAITPVNVMGLTGSYRRTAAVTVSPVVALSSLAVNPVQGGNQTFGTVTLNLPAITPVTVSLSADNAVVTMPASVTIASGQSSQTFTITAGMVTTATPVTITASYNGTALTAIENVSTTVPIVLSSITIPSVIGGQTFTGTVTLNHPAYVDGVTISIASSDPVLAPVPATIFIPYGSSTGYITGVAGAVVNANVITLTATLAGASVSGSFTISNGPGATIQSLDYWSVSRLIKVTATTTMPSGSLSFGVSPNGPALGLLAIEPTTGLYQGSASMSSPPSVIWVWNSAGGLPVSSTAVRIRSK